MRRRNVAIQERDPESELALYRRAMALRRSSEALRLGSYERVDAPEVVLAYMRESGPERVWVAVNFLPEEAALDPPAGEIVLATSREMEGLGTGGPLALPADGAVAVAVR